MVLGNHLTKLQKGVTQYDNVGMRGQYTSWLDHKAPKTDNDTKTDFVEVMQNNLQIVHKSEKRPTTCDESQQEGY